MKHKILFSFDGFFLHYCLAYYLQSHIDANFFALIDINSKPKKFFENQTLVKFQKIWFFHDHIKKTKQEPDLDHLINFEKRYNVDLWKLAINERFFYLHNRFYKFTKQEILSILEQESKLFESMLNEIKPDYFLTLFPVFHHQKLLLELCRTKKIKVLCAYGTGIANKMILVEDGGTFDLDPSSIKNNLLNNKIVMSNEENNSYDYVFKNYLQNRNRTFLNKVKALKDYLFDFDSELTSSNFMYYGRSKFKVTKDALVLELKRSRNYDFLNKYSTLSPILNVPFVYFPMNVVEEMNLLYHAPYYTDQVEVIRHIAKSIPINYVLYVKEHGAAAVRGWNSIDYYKQIIDIPNVKLIHPLYDNDVLIKNSKLLITIRGTSGLKAIKFGKPSIVFGEEPFRIMSSVFTVDSLNSLPNLIRTALNHKVNPIEYEKYKELLNERAFECNMFEFESNRDKSFFSGGILSNIPISKAVMIDFLTKNENLLSGIVNAHLKILT